MSLRYYANAAATTLTLDCSSGTSALSVDSVTGWPTQFPYVAIIDRGTTSEEVISVTAATGTNLTATRGYDGTTAFAHDAGAEVTLGISAIDPREANTHINSSSGVHGVAGALVGASATQALTNKDLTDSSNTFPGTLVTTTGTASLTHKTFDNTNVFGGFAASMVAFADASGNLSHTSSKAVPSGDFVGTNDTQTLTNKNIGPTNIISATTGTASHFASFDAPGRLLNNAIAVPAGTVVGTSDSQTLTNKNLADTSNVFPAFIKGASGVLVQGGQVTLTCTTVDQYVSTTITFPIAFSGTPGVIVQYNTSISDGANGYSVSVWANASSSTGTTINLRRGTLTTTTISWIAIGPA